MSLKEVSYAHLFIWSKYFENSNIVKYYDNFK